MGRRDGDEGSDFLDFRYFENDERIVRKYELKDTETNETSSDLSVMQLYFVEMPKFAKGSPDVRSDLDRWVAFMNNAEHLSRQTLPTELQTEPAIIKAAAELERIGLSADEREIYDSEVKALMIDQIQIKTAEDRALRQGIQQGVKQGMHDGMQQIILNQLSRKIGDVPATVAAKLSRLSTPDLNELSLALFDLDTYADVENWLTKH